MQTPGLVSHWIRQQNVRPMNEEKVYQVTKLGLSGEPDMIVAQTSKQSAQRLIAALAEHGEHGYRVSVFLHATLPGLQSPDLHPGWHAARQAEQLQGIER